VPGFFAVPRLTRFVPQTYKSRIHFRNNYQPDTTSYWFCLIFSLANQGEILQDSLHRIVDGWIARMPSDYARRGRPRGSGLDDRVQLRRIVELLEADPNLRPTTAIKAIGVSDPSTIRRLRDKLKLSDIQGGASNGGERESPVVHRPAELLEAHSSHSPVSVRRPADLGTGALAEAIPAASPDAHPSWVTQWCALGLSAVSSTVEAQMALMEDLLRVPHVESMLRQQLVFNEVAKAFCLMSSDVRSTLH